MKRMYADVALSFLSEQGYMFRFYGQRWWQLRDGYWRRDGREALELALQQHMVTFHPVARDKMNWVDVNQMCAFLALALNTSALPGVGKEPRNDTKLLRPGVRPRITGTPETRSE